MHAQDLLVYQGGNRETVEAVCKNFPQFNGVSTFALVVKSVNSID